MRKLILAAAVIALAGCSGSEEMSDSEKRFYAEEVAKITVGPKLKDPNSAVYSELQYYPEDEDSPVVVCGRVNSRNSFGALTGAQRFVVGGTVAIEEDFTKSEMDTIWNTMCR